MIFPKLLFKLAVVVLTLTLIITMLTLAFGATLDEGWQVTYRVSGYDSLGQSVREMDMDRGLSYGLISDMVNFTHVIISPDERFILLRERNANDDLSIWMLYDRRDNSMKQAYMVGADSQAPTWSPDSRQFVYYASGTMHIYAVSDDAQVSDPIHADIDLVVQVPVFFPVSWFGDSSGFLLIFPLTTSTLLFHIDADGAIVSERDLAFSYRGQISASPDSMRVVYALDAGESDQLFVLDVLSGAESMIFESSNTIRTAYWSADGREIAIVTLDMLGSQVHIVDSVTGSAQMIRQYSSERAMWADWSPLAQQVYFPIAGTVSTRSQGRYPVDMFVYVREDDITLGPIALDLSASVNWSPDSRAFVFQSALTGQLTVYNVADGIFQQITDRGRDYSLLP